jgi:hypothetical protein
MIDRKITVEIEHKHSQKYRIQLTGDSCTTLVLKCGYHDGKPAAVAVIPLVSPLLHLVPYA